MDMVLCCSLVIKGRAELLKSGAVSLCKACVMCLNTHRFFLLPSPGEPSPCQRGDHQHGGGDVHGRAAAAGSSRRTREEEQSGQREVSLWPSLVLLPPNHTWGPL